MAIFPMTLIDQLDLQRDSRVAAFFECGFS